MDAGMVWAAKENILQVAELLIDRGHGINRQEAKEDKAVNGYAPIHWAASKGHIEMVILLLNRGASVLTKDKHGNSPKDLSEKKGFTDIFTILEGAEKAQARATSFDASAFVKARGIKIPDRDTDSSTPRKVMRNKTALVQPSQAEQIASAPAQAAGQPPARAGDLITAQKTLPIRVEKTLDPKVENAVVGELMQGQSAWIIEQTEVIPGIWRSLIALSAGGQPKGWVTSSKDGTQLLALQAVE